MKVYLLVSSGWMIIWALAWSKSNALNFFVKVAFAGLAVWGLVERFAP